MMHSIKKRSFKYFLNSLYLIWTVKSIHHLIRAEAQTATAAKMPCFVIHWHAYFPTGLFYLLPGPCLPCSKFDVSGYQFIPTWNKEKIIIRDKQHHIHKHHQNTTFKHMSSMRMRLMFSYTYSTFPLQTIYLYFSLFIGISLPSL